MHISLGTVHKGVPHPRMSIATTIMLPCRAYIFATMVYGLARKAPVCWDGSLLAKDGDAIKTRPMLLGERLQVAVLSAGLAPLMGPSWALHDIIHMEIAARGGDARRYGYEPSETMMQHVLA